jgi:Rieske Fe-S protein
LKYLSKEENKDNIGNDASSDNLSRRVFLKLLLGFSAIVSALPLSPIVKFFFASPSEDNPQRKKIANIREVPMGSTLVFLYPGEEGAHRSFLTHLTSEYRQEAKQNSYPYINNGFVAFNSVCTHLLCPIELPDDDASICPCHGAIFSVVDGTVLGGPAPRPLPAIKLEINEDTGDIYATELIGKIGYGRD